MNPDLRQALQAHLEQTGESEEHFIEQAVLHHLRAQQELPSFHITRPELIINARFGESLLRQIEEALPNDPLGELLRSGD